MHLAPAAAFGHRFFKPRTRIEVEREDQIGVRLRIAGRGGERRAEGIDRIFDPAAPEQRKRQVAARGGQARMGGDEPAEDLCRRNIVLAPGKGDAHAELRLDMRRVDRHSVPERGERRAPVLERNKRVAEVDAMRGNAGLGDGTHPVGSHRLVEPSELGVQLAEIGHRDHKVGCGRDGVAECLERLLRPAGGDVHRAEAVPGVLVVRRVDKARLDQRQGAVVHAEPAGDVAQPPQRLGLLGLGDENRLVGAPRLRQVAGFVECAGAIEIGAVGLGQAHMTFGGDGPDDPAVMVNRRLPSAHSPSSSGC